MSLEQGMEDICYTFITEQCSTIAENLLYFMLEHQLFCLKQAPYQTQTVYFKQEVLSFTEELYFIHKPLQF